MADEDDPNNPQRAAVLAMERRHIEGQMFVRMRVEAMLHDAAVTAICPGNNVDEEIFVGWARQSYIDARELLDDLVQEEVDRRELQLSDNTNSNEEKPS